MSRPNLAVRRVLAAALAALAAGALFGAGAGCASLGVPGNRLMSCESNDDCKKKDPKTPTCANLRCVECAYDSDCESGVCTNNQCKKLFTSPGEGDPEGPPQNLDACLSRCNDQDCTNKCNDQFRPAPKPE